MFADNAHDDELLVGQRQSERYFGSFGYVVADDENRVFVKLVKLKIKVLLKELR